MIISHLRKSKVDIWDGKRIQAPVLLLSQSHSGQGLLTTHSPWLWILTQNFHVPDSRKHPASQSHCEVSLIILSL